jgi:prepilin-type N-terminal cleavage/methylation domain-containing protein
MIQKDNRQSGFTMIELIIVILIMGILSSMLIINFRAGERQKRVNLTRDTVITALRASQNFSLAGKQIPADAVRVRGSNRCSGDNAAVSYWTEMTTGQNIDVMAEDRCGAIMRIQQFTLVLQTRFKPTSPFALTPGGNGTAVAFRFTPPFGNMTATKNLNPLPGDFTAFTSGTINVEFQDGQRPRVITVDGISGRIE